MNLQDKQRGAAIIVALFVVALVAIAATIMIERLRIDTRRTELIQNSTTAYLYAQGSVIWAIDELNNNWKQKKPDQLVDKTPIRSPIDRQNGVSISSVIYDAQGYFNINNLIEENYQKYFARLIEAVAPDMNGDAAQALTAAILDWISPTKNNLELNEYYLKSSPSYRAPHRPMVSISELRLVKGLTASLYSRLVPFLFALPTSSPININNATAPVFMALSPKITLDSANALDKLTKQTPFTDTKKFLDTDIAKNNEIDASQITVTSNYFLVETNVTVGKQKLILFTLLERKSQDTQAKTYIVWQSKGTL